MKMKHFLVMVFCTLSLYSSAQNICACPAYNQINDKYKEDSIKAQYFWKEKIDICKAKGHEKYALHLLKINALDSVLYYLERAKAIYDKTTCGDSVYMQTYKFIAQYYYTTTDFAKTQEYCLKLLKSAEHAKSTWEIASCYTMIAQVFNQTGQAEKGVTYTRRAALLLPKIKDPKLEIEMLFKLSKRFLWHYQDTKSKGSLDSSEMYSTMQLEMGKQQKNNYQITKAFNNLQGIEYEKGNFKKALTLIDSSFQYTDNLSYGDLAVNFYDKADILIEMNNLKEANANADSCLYYHILTKNKAYIADAYQLKERIAKLTGNYKLAY
jgi:hypothetical protein